MCVQSGIFNGGPHIFSEEPENRFVLLKTDLSLIHSLPPKVKLFILPITSTSVYQLISSFIFTLSFPFELFSGCFYYVLELNALSLIK